MEADFLNYKNQGWVLKIAGLLLLLAGSAVGLLAPLEMYCFYLFSAGGRFHYEGFGFGSFMFGNIASQIIGYYLIAAVLITLGYGHLTRKSWIRKGMIALSWTWLVIGSPMIVIVFFILIASKTLSLAAAVAALVFLCLSYLVLPAFLIRYYQGINIRKTLENTPNRSVWVENLPVPILVQVSLYLFLFIVLHILIFFNGIFPLFGTFLSGFQGIIAIDISIAAIAVLIWGTLNLQAWSWWSSVILMGLFSLSTAVTFARYSFTDLLSVLAFPPAEVQFLQGIPAKGYHFAILTGIPLVLTWLLVLFSRRYFRSRIDNSANRMARS
jgi:hypothetical protein